MKKSIMAIMCIMLILFSCEQTEGDDSDDDAVSGATPTENPEGLTYTVRLDFQGNTNMTPNGGYKYCYVCWLEDESGENIQNIYVCSKATPPDTNGLTGHGLPVWSRPTDGAYYDFVETDIDAVSGSTQYGTVSIERELKNSAVRKFRVCFEIDRSKNSNDYFNDRPAFLYKSALIDLDNLGGPYPLALDGWMINNTVGNVSWSQSPKDYGDIPFLTDDDSSTYKYIDSSIALDFTKYIAPVGDMVDTLSVSIAAE